MQAVSQKKKRRAGLRRLGVGLAAVVVSLALAGNAFGSLTGVRSGELSPVAVYRGVEREAHLAYGRAARFVGHLRLFYEINAQLREPKAEASDAANEKRLDHGSGYECTAAATAILPSR
ncbi:MAG: hypothetical protein ACE5IP_11015 [Terriglobia bacterium]